MAEEARPVVLASEILDKIQKGEPVEYDNVIIEGDLDLSKLDLPTEQAKRIAKSAIVVAPEMVCKGMGGRIKITNSEIKGVLRFRNCIFRDGTDSDFGGSQFRGDADFRGSKFKGDDNFGGSTFRGNANFRGSTFRGNANFRGSQFSGGADFEGSEFCGLEAHFEGSTFRGDANFRGSTFRGSADFGGSTFRGDANFRGSTFRGDADFGGSTFRGDVLTFREATFDKPKSQEKACRRAKNVLAKAGNRDEEEYHFYREMEAKRIQKGIRGSDFPKNEIIPALTDSLEKREWPKFLDFFLYDILEFIFVQKIFGYGVHPFWLFGWWLALVLIFAIIYSIKGGLEEPEARQWYDFFWFSVATAATPGYALYKPFGWFKFIAGIEAILGTFMWAAFITTFARKFMR